SRELRAYDETRGYYVGDADTYIAEWVRSKFTEMGKTASQGFVTEVVATARDRSYRDRPSVNPPWFVVVQNGVLNVKTGELGPHAPDPVFTFGLPVPYDPSAICPTFDAFLERSLPDPVQREAVLEFAGYFLWPGNPFRKLAVVWGPTTTGKSTYTAILIGVYGTENV
ncbi:Phage/plasmid primase P4-like protein, partial [mine drainage metagenome]